MRNKTTITFFVNNSDANVNTFNIQITKVSGYAFQKNPQNNHIIIRWVGEN